MLARAARIPPCEAFAVRLVWQPRDRRRRDADNPFPTIKTAVDGLVDAGVVADDDHTRVRHDGVHIIQPDPGQKTGRMWLEVTPL